MRYKSSHRGPASSLLNWDGPYTTVIATPSPGLRRQRIWKDASLARSLEEVTNGYLTPHPEGAPRYLSFGRQRGSSTLHRYASTPRDRLEVDICHGQSTEHFVDSGAPNNASLASMCPSCRVRESNACWGISKCVFELLGAEATHVKAKR